MEKLRVFMDESGVPTMETPLGFLSYFRGYRVQFSDTERGVGDNGGSPTTLDWDMRYFRNYFKPEYRMIPFAAHMLHAYIHAYGVSAEFFVEHMEEVMEFIQNTSHEMYYNKTPFKAFEEVVVTDLTADKVQAYKVMAHKVLAEQATTAEGTVNTLGYAQCEVGPNNTLISYCVCYADKITLLDFIGNKEITWNYSNAFVGEEEANEFIECLRGVHCPEQASVVGNLMNFLGWFVSTPTASQKFAAVISGMRYDSPVKVEYPVPAWVVDAFSTYAPGDTAQQSGEKTSLFN